MLVLPPRGHQGSQNGDGNVPRRDAIGREKEVGRRAASRNPVGEKNEIACAAPPVQKGSSGGTRSRHDKWALPANLDP